ncbi:MAG: peptidase M48 [Acidobacteria bacterium]|nr:MAG: peptidase M48 [Acidobacteriota bacterium]REK00098.1 MAG: peptidase M48 [Acidobacteriota bacterium]
MGQLMEDRPRARRGSGELDGSGAESAHCSSARSSARLSRRSLAAVSATVCATAFLTSCSVNPATGERELSLVSEAQEIAIGRQNDEAIVAQYGLYPDEEWQRYIQDLGSRLAAASERPDLPWTFRVLDDPLVNAFALPGGFIYITRGILAHLNSEAELVGVLGHEIGHVTARHGASQMSKAMLAQLGLGVGAILAPEEAQSYGGLAVAATQLLFLKYGRDDERQADALGVRYSLREGFDARELVGVFETLGRVSAASGRSGLPGWASTHPSSEDRTERIQALVARSELPPRLEVGRDSYLRRLDGIVFGDNPRHGFFRGSTFLHPDMAFQLEFPEGWQTQNGRQAVVALSPQKDAVVQLTLAAGDSPQTAANSFFEQQGVLAGQAWSSGYSPDIARGFAVEDQQGQRVVEGWVAHVEQGDQLFQLLGYARPNVVAARGPALRASLSSLRPLRERRWLDVQPMRLQVAAVDRTEPVERVEALRSSIPQDEILLINRLDPGQTLQRGTLVKRVEGVDPSSD